MSRIKILTCYATTGLLMAFAATTFATGQASTTEKHVPVTFIGGHDTDRRDGGRPVVLVAAALGVPTETFRKAFSGVTPARGREPDPEQVHRNKDALLAVLAPYGITNDRLDTVSDFYRYQPQRGGLWRNTPASAYAIVVNGKVTGFKITTPGAGYSSTPTVTIPGYEDLSTKATIAYTKNLQTNGSITSIAIELKTK